MTAETQIREGIARLVKSLYDRGFSVGSAGNLSAAVADGLLITPTIPVWASSTRHVSPSSTRTGATFPATSRRRRFSSTAPSRALPAKVARLWR
nr:hypothetical protein [Aestuariivirga sp. YIM B02566]